MDIFIGCPRNCWKWGSSTGFDLTRQDGARQRRRVLLHCEIRDVSIDPDMTVLLVVGMQNINLHSIFLPNPSMVTDEKKINMLWLR